MTRKPRMGPASVRCPPPRFCWIDQRRVRHHDDGEPCGPTALALFPVTLADVKGWRVYYGQHPLRRMDRETPALVRVRDWLTPLHWINWQAPPYPVLALEAGDD